MMELVEMLRSLDPQAQAAIAGFLAWAVTQAIKAAWKPPEEWKLQKLLVAIFIAGFSALATEFTGAGGFLLQWLAAAATAIGTHELTDKAGLQSLLKRDTPYNYDEAGNLR